jgi:hypothetical protein
MAISRLNLGTTNQGLVKAAAGQTSNLLELQNSSGTVVAGLNQDGVWSGTAEPGLVLLNTTSFSAVSSQSVSDVFNSTYDSYRIIISSIASVNGSELRMRLRVSGTDATGSDYYGNHISMNFGGTTVTGGAIGAGAGGTSLFLRQNETSYTNPTILDIHRPNFAQSTYFLGSAYGNGNWYLVGQQHAVATAYTGFTFFPASGTITGNVRVYGYNQ